LGKGNVAPQSNPEPELSGKAERRTKIFGCSQGKGGEEESEKCDSGPSSRRTFSSEVEGGGGQPSGGAAG